MFYDKFDAIEKLHRASIIHGYICPDSLVLAKKDQGYYVFFRKLENSFFKKNIVNIQRKRVRNDFESLSENMGLSSSYRDDFEALVYTLLFMIDDTFEIKIQKNEHSNRDLKENLKKNNFLCKNIPIEISELFYYVSLVSFNSVLDGEYIRGRFLNFFENRNIDIHTVSIIPD